ncbi:unnamed protein product [Linum tenue]|uniref:Uncharacterized protein n=1 Tax=Linum tenue TaxID=586396 RepID=A0AAV0QS80_9ROSI|nr:unnamed protein product [Linum tenue]
MIQVLPLLAA